MARLNGGNRRRGAEDGFVAEEGRGAEVGRHADIFEDGSRLHHAGGVGEAKVVLAALDGFHAALREGRLEETDVLGLGLADLLQVGNLLLVEAERGKVGLFELGEAFAVKGLFEVFEGEGAGDLVSSCFVLLLRSV